MVPIILSAFQSELYPELVNFRMFLFTPIVLREYIKYARVDC